MHIEHRHSMLPEQIFQALSQRNSLPKNLFHSTAKDLMEKDSPEAYRHNKKKIEKKRGGGCQAQGILTREQDKDYAWKARGYEI